MTHAQIKEVRSQQGNDQSHLEIRKYQALDEEGICNLHNVVFSHSDYWELPLWRWKFHQGQDNIFLCFDEEGIAGHLGGVPKRFYIDGEPIEAAQVTDAMIAVRAREHGAFLRIAIPCLSNLRRKYPLVYSYLNGNAIPLYEKGFRWTSVTPHLPVYLKPLNFQSLVKKKIGAFLAPLGASVDLFLKVFNFSRSLPDGLNFRNTSKFGNTFSELWSHCPYRSRVSLERNHQYLNWRYTDSPFLYKNICLFEGNRLRGYGIYRMVDRFGLKLGLLMEHISDTEDPTINRVLLARLLEELRSQGADLVASLSLKNSPWTVILRRAGFLRPPLSLLPHPLVLSVAPTSKDLSKIISSPDNWFISFGDVDSV